MDRLKQVREEAGTSRDSTLDISSPPSEAFMTANESSSKYFSLSEVDSTFDISPIKDVAITSATVNSNRPNADSERLISNLSPIGKKDKDLLDSYKIGKQIEAANILSGGVDIFDDNENSYDGDELVIDDNAENDDKSNIEMKSTESGQFKNDDSSTEETLVEPDTVCKDTEVILQIDGKNVDAIDIGNGLYLYRKEGQEELAAVQIIEDDQHPSQPSFKFLKCRENDEGNLEVYEEIQIEVPKEMPVKEGKVRVKNVSHLPIKDINKVMSDTTSNKAAERKNKVLNEQAPIVVTDSIQESSKELQAECKTEVNVNGKMMKISESRKSPVVGSYTPMTYHSTPNKEGIPLTKTMVDLQLHPNRHSDNVKKTIEVHTDSAKQKPVESPAKSDIKQSGDLNKESLSDSNRKIDLNNIKKSDTNKIIKTQENITQIKETNILIDKISSAECQETPKATLIVSEANRELGEVTSKEVFKTNEEIEYTDKLKVDCTDQVDCKSAKQLEVCAADNTKEITKTENLPLSKVTAENMDITKTEILPLSNTHLSLSEEKGLEKCTPSLSNISDYRKNKEIGSKDFIIADDIKTNTIEVFNSKQPTACTNIGVKLDDVYEKNKVGVENSKNIHQEDNNKTLDDKNIVKNNNESVGSQESVNIQHKVITDSFHANEEPAKNPNICKDSLNDQQDHNKESLLKNVILDKVALECKPPDSENLAITDKEPELTSYVEMQLSHSIDKSGDTNKNIPASKISPHKPSKESKDVHVSSPNIGKETKQDTDEVTAKPETSEVHVTTTVQEVINITANINVPTVTDANTNLAIVISDATDSKDIRGFKIQDTHSNTDQITINPKANAPDKKDSIKTNTVIEPKPIHNNHAPVPFGKWTDANRQAFVNKFKESSKVPTNSSNGKQIKNSNDLNRRDVLKKIDSQRQTQATIALAKSQELGGINRLGTKKESTAFSSRPSGIQNSKVQTKPDAPISKSTLPAKLNITEKSIIATKSCESINIIAETKKETVKRKEINNQDLIDKTIEGIINRAVPVKNSQDDNNQSISKDLTKSSKKCNLSSNEPPPLGFDELEMKMNELHGIPFIERPDYELPRVHNPAPKAFGKSEIQNVTSNKQTKIPNLIPFASSNQSKGVKENIIEVDSEEEIIEHEPITGDMELEKKNAAKPIVPENITQINSDPKKEAIITENDFDKFVRRNSIKADENCLTVKLDSNESHNVIQSVVPKDIVLKTYSKHDVLHAEVKTLPRKLEFKEQNIPIKSNQTLTNYVKSVENDDSSKNYQSKVKMAYQTAMTVKRQMERPITIIDDKPVKVVFLDSATEYHPSQLNVQGKELSPPKKLLTSADIAATGTSESLDSDTLESVYEGKASDETKVKTKHQRKQVLTPVEIELIEPDELGIDISPKKKRKTEEKVEKSLKALVPKKSYLLGRTMTTEETVKPYDLTNILPKEPSACDDSHSTIISPHKNTATAIDNLVKAAELLETQEGNRISSASDVPTSDSPQNTPAKRGRGRPRKYPLPEGVNEKSTIPSPQKKPRLIDAKVVKNKDTDEETSSDEELIRENWTMGKINENIVCPICKKLFRSENVVFKHVKHCTGPSPNRSDSDNRSPRRHRLSQESETLSHDSKSDDMDIDDNVYLQRYARKKRKSREMQTKIVSEKDDIIVIEDTPIKAKPDKKDEKKYQDIKKNLVINKNKISDKNNSLVCEICGKTFRQMSYLANHKLQHGKEDVKKEEPDSTKTSKSVFSCEVCKKDFRKLHHLVQHRIIHNTNNIVPSKPPRKNSSEPKEDKVNKEQNLPKQNEDLSAGFRCEPCDKSFRKLHHLVEHRETHDGINRQKNVTNIPVPVEKVPPPPQCDKCKKTFRKLHHLIEHKEQHLETSSEKSDDKSVRSSLSTRDIIHECSLCYMVFPNEHSLNKHTIICQRKKRQSATKPPKQDDEQHEEQVKTIILGDNNEKDNNDDKDDVTLIAEIKDTSETRTELSTNIIEPVTEKEKTARINVDDIELTKDPLKAGNSQEKPKTTTNVDLPKFDINTVKEAIDTPIKIKKPEDKKAHKIQETHKKKTPLKDKAAPTVTKRHKPNVTIQDNKGAIKSTESSDEDEIRYMLNPDYKDESEIFMKVRANKRNSLQIERPNSKDLVKRRISLQHPPKVPRLKPKPVQTKAHTTQPTNSAAPTKTITKIAKLEPVPSIDSDDNDVKYSFPKSSVSNPSKGEHEKISSKDSVKKTQKKSLAEKRKSLSSIAKRKSLGKGVGAKLKPKPSPMKPVKKRTTEVEHRCDCGQLFSSAALLSRHTTLAHTPPRRRARRDPSPSPAPATTPSAATAPSAPATAPARARPRPRTSYPTLNTDSRKSTAKTDAGNSTQKPNNLPNTTRKSNNRNETNKTPETRKSMKSNDKTDNGTSNVKLRRFAAHKGVPVPEKMRKLMEKTKK